MGSKDNSETRTVSEVVETVLEETDGEEVVVADLQDAFASKSYGPLLLVPSLIAISPVGAIPLVPTVLGVLIFCISLQLSLGRKSPWLPKRLRERGVQRQKLEQANKKIKPYLEKGEKVLRPRLHKLFTPPLLNGIGILCALLALAMPPLEVLPGAVFVPAAALCCISAALTNEDGVVLLLGATISVLGGFAIWRWLAG
ncbi:exopolysaccharide biosynthesis protein [bacterium]|nr:exopolysaccharide biosynthesis protein [bacterium]